MLSQREVLHRPVCHPTRPRVVHIVRSLEVGGLEKVVCELVSARGVADTDVICLTAEGEFAETLRTQGGKVFVLKEKGNARQLVRPLARMLRKIQPDLIHCHNMFAHMTGRLATMLAGGIPTVLTKHGTHLPRGRTGSTIHRGLLRKASVVAVSSEIQDIMVTWAPFLRDRIITIPNGVSIPRERDDSSRIAIRESLGWSGDDWIFITVSRLVAGKRVSDVIRAFQKARAGFPHAKLLIVGDGPEFASLQRLVAEQSLSDGVKCLGERLDVPHLLTAADTFVLASENEGLPMSLLEAMSAHLPVIVTEVGEMPIVAEQGVCGYVVPTRSEQSLVVAMTKILADPDSARTLGKNSYDRVENCFSIRSTIEKYEAVYRTAICRGKRSVASAESTMPDEDGQSPQ